MIKQRAAGVLLLFAIVITVSCSSLSYEDKKFLKVDETAPVTFKVLISSDMYKVAQMKYTDRVKRSPDRSGDEYIMEEIQKYNKINEKRDGILRIWLYPDTGRLMKVRFGKSTYLRELDDLIFEDIQRWSFEFANNYVSPTKMHIHYRIILKKKQSDDEIIKEVRKKMMKD